MLQVTFNFENLTAEILNNVKSELDFKSEVFRAKEVFALKEALDKEKKLYSKMGVVKDDLDSQHFWAGGKIKNMKGKMNMDFKGGTILHDPTAAMEKEVEGD